MDSSCYTFRAAMYSANGVSERELPFEESKQTKLLVAHNAALAAMMRTLLSQVCSAE